MLRSPYLGLVPSSPPSNRQRKVVCFLLGHGWQFFFCFLFFFFWIFFLNFFVFFFGRFVSHHEPTHIQHSPQTVFDWGFVQSTSVYVSAKTSYVSTKTSFPSIFISFQWTNHKCTYCNHAASEDTITRVCNHDLTNAVIGHTGLKKEREMEGKAPSVSRSFSWSNCNHDHHATPLYTIFLHHYYYYYYTYYYYYFYYYDYYYTTTTTINTTSWNVRDHGVRN